jgi:hypothetical protein
VDRVSLAAFEKDLKGNLRVRGDRDHRFQAIVITLSRAIVITVSRRS